tara:strand:- start:124 stop:330 length:207 start_codon:yes stop_codon:yes gene_type:complete
MEIPNVGSLVRVVKYIGSESVITYDIVTKIRYYKIGREDFPIAFYTIQDRSIPLPFEGINFSYKVITL